MESTASALNDLITNPKLEGGLSTYEVRLGFGLHVGWAIEGTIGSKHKVEASYLSPHVNLAARLESATKQYGVTYLYSEAFYTNLSKRMKKRSRHIDCVCVRGSSVPMNMYTYLRTPLPDFQVFAADLGRLERKLSSDICGSIVSTLLLCLLNLIVGSLPSTRNSLIKGPVHGNHGIVHPRQLGSCKRLDGNLAHLRSGGHLCSRDRRLHEEVSLQDSERLGGH